MPAADALWNQLRTHLERRYRALFEEVRHYPTPIAHCDDQLPKLIAQRSHTLTQLQRMGETDLPTVEYMQAYVEASPAGDDDLETDILKRLAKALGVTPLIKGADMAAGHAGGFAGLLDAASVRRKSPGTPDGVSAPFHKGDNSVRAELS